MKKMRSCLAKMIVLVAPMILLAGAGAAQAAGSKSFTGSFSGTQVTVPLDISLETCTGTPYVCTGLSGYFNYGTQIKGGGNLAG